MTVVPLTVQIEGVLEEVEMDPVPVPPENEKLVELPAISEVGDEIVIKAWLSSVADVTEKFVPRFAAAYVLSAALIVIIVHVPVARAVTTVLETVHVEVVNELYVMEPAPLPPDVERFAVAPTLSGVETLVVIEACGSKAGIITSSTATCTY